MKAVITILLLCIAVAASARKPIIDTSKYDKQIIRIIERNADLRKVPHRADSIRAQTMRLSFIKDCYWDGCGPKIEIYPQPFTFGVVMKINGQTIERCYYMSGAKQVEKRKWDDSTLQYRNTFNCPGFVAQARASCGGKK